MRNIMQDPSLGREAVLLPLPLDMDQCGLTQAIDRMLERGYGIELDPYYADTIVRRFEDAYGLKAVHVESELEFVKLSAQRLASGKKSHGQKGKTRYVKNGKKLRAKGRSR
jgi:hypothetical protein